MKSMKVATSLGLDGSMEARFLYSFPSSDVAGAEEALKNALLVVAMTRLRFARTTTPPS